MDEYDTAIRLKFFPRRFEVGGFKITRVQGHFSNKRVIVGSLKIPKRSTDETKRRRWSYNLFEEVYASSLVLLLLLPIILPRSALTETPRRRRANEPSVSGVATRVAMERSFHVKRQHCRREHVH